MVYYIENTVHINAPRDFTAEVLYGFSSFPQWNWLIRTLVGSQLTKAPQRPEPELKSDLDTPAGSTSALAVQPADTNEFGWHETSGRRIFFKGRHQFVFTKEDESGSECETATKYTHREELRGALAWLFFLFFRGTLKRGYAKMASDFKAVVEAQYATQGGNGAQAPT